MYTTLFLNNQKSIHMIICNAYNYIYIYDIYKLLYKLYIYIYIY